MTTLQKSILAWVGIGVLVLVGVFFIVTINQVSNSAPTTNTVTFQGEGKVSSKPDMAVVNFSILTTAATSKGAQDANSVRSKKVSDFLAKQGVADKDIKTTYYTINPQYGTQPTPAPVIMMQGISSSDAISAYPRMMPVPSGQPRITGYQVEQGYEVKVRDFDKVSVIVDGLVSVGANQVSNVRFDFENRDTILAQAREKAIADAKDKAQKLQSQIGIKIGKIVNYYDNTVGYPYYAKGDYGMGGGGATAMSGPILPPGENEIVVNVSITYQIK